MVRPQAERRQRIPARIPAGRHPFLTFQFQDEENEVVQLLQKRWLDVYYFDRTVFELLGIAEDLDSYLSAPWMSLLRIQDTQFMEPTIQFMMTFSFNPAVTRLDSPAVIFTLGRQHFELSYREFAAALGIFSGPAIQVLGEYPDPSEIEMYEFFSSVASRAFETSNTKATAFTDPRIHVLHRLLAYTIFNRRESANNVNLTDLQVLMPLWQHTPICPAMSLLRGLQRFSSLRNRQGGMLGGGQYVTRLGRRLQAWTPADEETFTRCGIIRPLSMDSLRQAKLVKRIQGIDRLVRGNIPWDRPTDEAEETEEAESSRAGSRRRRRRRRESGEEMEEAGGDDIEPMEHEEPQPAAPQYRYGMPQGWEFPDPQSYDAYVAYHHMGGGISSIGTGIDGLTTRFETFTVDWQRQRTRNSRNTQAIDQRLSNLGRGVTSLNQYGEEFRESQAETMAFRDEMRSGMAALNTRLDGMESAHHEDYEHLQSTMNAFRNEHSQLRDDFYKFTDDYFSVPQTQDDDDDEDDD